MAVAAEKVATLQSVQNKPRAQAQGDGSARLLARLLQLTSAALAASSEQEAQQIISKRLRELIPVDRVVLVQLAGKRQIAAVDVGSDEVRESEFAQQLLRFAAKNKKLARPQSWPLAANSNSSESSATGLVEDPRSLKQQQAMNGTAVLWWPIVVRADSADAPRYGLWLERWNQREWQASDRDLLARLNPFLAQALAPKPKTRVWRKPLLWTAAAAIAAIAAVWPVSQSAVAVAQVAPIEPEIIYAPLDGVVDEVHVRPGQTVAVGDLLLSFDDRLPKRLHEEARQELQVARAELARLQGAAYQATEARAALPVQRLEVERAEQALAFRFSELQRVQVRASVAGQILLDDPEKLEGAAVRLGEQLLSVADPSRTQLRLEVSVRDAGIFAEQADVTVRLNSDPLKPKTATVRRLGYDVTKSESEQPVIMVEAVWQEPDKATALPGEQGSARIYGEQTLLIFQVFRKPLIAVLDVLGF